MKKWFITQNLYYLYNCKPPSEQLQFKLNCKVNQIELLSKSN